MRTIVLCLTHRAAVITEWQNYGLILNAYNKIWYSLLAWGHTVWFQTFSPEMHSKSLHAWDNRRGPTRSKTPRCARSPSGHRCAGPFVFRTQTELITPLPSLKGSRRKNTKRQGNNQDRHSTLIANKKRLVLVQYVYCKTLYSSV